MNVEMIHDAPHSIGPLVKLYENQVANSDIMYNSLRSCDVDPLVFHHRPQSEAKARMDPADERIPSNTEDFLLGRLGPSLNRRKCGELQGDESSSVVFQECLLSNVQQSWDQLLRNELELLKPHATCSLSALLEEELCQAQPKEPADCHIGRIIIFNRNAVSGRNHEAQSSSLRDIGLRQEQLRRNQAKSNYLSDDYRRFYKKQKCHHWQNGNDFRSPQYDDLEMSLKQLVY